MEVLVNKTNIFINKAELVHGNTYNYEMVNYVNAKIKINIICDIHGVFEQRPTNHLDGRGCDKCGFISTHEKQRSNVDCFINKAKKIHKNKYNYSLVEYKSNGIKVKIICKKHGIFEQRPNDHLNNQGCYKCNESKGEKEITEFLENNNIFFIKQKRFSECKYKNPLPFDFYLPNNNICIEYNGIQHYKPVKRFGGEKIFETQQIKDNIKQKYCQSNNIQLEIIKYSDDLVNKLIKLI